MPFPLDLLNNFRQVVMFWNGRYATHPYGSKYVKLFETTEDYVILGFEDLDEGAGFTPDYDYSNPKVKIHYVDGYLLVYIINHTMKPPVMTSWIYYMYSKVYEFIKPETTTEPRYVLIDPTTGTVISVGDYLKHLIKIPAVISVWGVNIVRVGTTIKIHATAEDEGMTLKIVVTKPDGSKVEGIMEDLGGRNYGYDVTFDMAGEYLIEIVYPDGFKRKKVVLVY